jgi:hypothetical protein
MDRRSGRVDESGGTIVKLSPRERRALRWLVLILAAYYGAQTVGHVLGLMALVGRIVGG